MDAPLFGIEVQLPKLAPLVLCEYFQLVIAEPPSPFELQVRATDFSPVVPVGWPGAGGLVAGVAASEAGEASPSPLAFTARTLNLYDVPFVRPVTV